MSGVAAFQKIDGTISRIEPSRHFIDGVYCLEIEFTDSGGELCRLNGVFFPLKLVSILKSGTAGEFYFWNSHCYAFRSGQDYIEDIEGARASYFKRDARLLLFMAASVILLPYALFVAVKKWVLGSSRRRMQMFLASGQR
jgi:hypothetical protein